MGYPALFTTPGVRQFAEEVDAERQRQLAKFGDQHHPDGTGYEGSEGHADFWRKRCEDAFADEEGTWGHVLLEEVFEAMAEADPVRLRAELVQVAAVCAGWIADLDSRTTEGTRRVADETAPTETDGAQRLCGKTRGVSGLYYRPCARTAGHKEAYCRSADGGHLFLAAPPMDPVHILGIAADDEPAAGARQDGADRG
ncbi:hypothetical protein ACFVOB_15030 [Streptomyces rochei]|uniref:hypothetical protein n=1 Tax=Streptomyces rochei TaxID=1928 RepID=UPI0036AEBB48